MVRTLRRDPKLFAKILLALLASACGGQTSHVGSQPDAQADATGSSGSSSGSSGSPGSGSSGGSSSGSEVDNCPASPPAASSACVPPWYPGLRVFQVTHCTWGDDPRPNCRTRATCNAINGTYSGTWDVSLPDAQACSTPLLPAACPMPPPATTTMTACSPPTGGSTLDCYYGDGTQCHCTACQDYPACNGPPTTPYWRCEKPPPGCPSTLPAAGSPCNTLGASCGPDCSLVVQCDGIWEWLGNQCPVCAAPDTPLSTPQGERPIASLAPGDLVYSVDHDAIVAVPLVRVTRRPVANHHVMRVVLADGAVLQISPDHPTADGRPFGELTAGSAIDDAHRVVSAELVPYGYDATYDVLPASSTGTYFAAGALVASTLFAPAGRHTEP